MTTIIILAAVLYVGAIFSEQVQRLAVYAREVAMFIASKLRTLWSK